MFWLVLILTVWHAAAVPQLLGKAKLAEDSLKKSSRDGRHGLATVPLPIPLGVGQPAASVASLGPQWSTVDPNAVGATAGKVGTWLCGVFTAAGGALHSAKRKQQPRRRRGQPQHALVQVDNTEVEEQFEQEQAPQHEETQQQEVPQQQFALQAFPMHQFQQQQFPQLQQQQQVFLPLQQMPQAQHMPQQQQQQQPVIVGMQPVEAFVWVPIGQIGWATTPTSETAQTWISTESTQTAESSPSVSSARFSGNARQLAMPTMAMSPHNAVAWQEGGPVLMPAVAMSPTHGATWQDNQSAASSFTGPQGSVSQAPANTAKAKCTAKEAEMLVLQLKRGTEAQRKAALEHVTRVAWSLALTRHGCRVVQTAFDVASTSGRLVLADGLKGRVLEALRSPHANHVLQKCVAVLPPDRVLFVVSELSGHAREAAKHAFGCRVLERLLEHCPHWQTQGLASEVLEGVSELARHPYGNYVIQHLLEHGIPEHRRDVAIALAPEVRRLARHKIASNVVEKALTYCAEDERQLLKEAMIGSAEELASLEHSNYGSFVVKEMRRR